MMFTPTLIHMGEKDARVPVQHGISLHRARKNRSHGQAQS